ncbi:MAG: hypothetical protein Q8P21_02765 [bacterium]|nr:hypothetical protein [bacterium]
MKWYEALTRRLLAAHKHMSVHPNDSTAGTIVTLLGLARESDDLPVHAAHKLAEILAPLPMLFDDTKCQFKTRKFVEKILKDFRDRREERPMLDQSDVDRWNKI